MPIRDSDWFRPVRLTFHSIHVRGKTNWLFLELSDGDGLTGLAEITATQLQRSPASVTARLANRLRGERLTSDASVLEIAGLGAAELEKDQVMATAVSGLRCAVADALARRADLPLAAYLRALRDQRGAPPPRVELYANINRSMLEDDRGPVDRSPDAFAAMAKQAADNGFTTLKCAPFDECREPFESPGLPPEADRGLERVRAAKEAIGAERTLYVDCHSRFDLESALALAPELRDAGAGWFEEPLDPIKHQSDVRTVREKSGLPVAGAEHGYGTDLFRRLVEEEVLDIVMPDVKFCGGPVEAYRTGVDLESLRPGTVSMHCPSGPVSLLASAHATAAFGNVLPLEHAVYEVEWRHEVLEPHERISDGRFSLPEGPGLGAWVNPLAVEQHGRRWEP